MLYTYIPEWQIMESNTGVDDSGVSYVSARYNGEDVTLLKTESGEYFINKLNSTNPYNYLKKEFMPGTAVKPGEFKVR